MLLLQHRLHLQRLLQLRHLDMMALALVLMHQETWSDVSANSKPWTPRGMTAITHGIHSFKGKLEARLSMAPRLTPTWRVDDPWKLHPLESG